MEKYWIKIKKLNFYSIKVRANTEWKFMEFISDDGISGISEITDTQLNSPVSKLVADFSNRLRDEKLTSEEDLLRYLIKENKCSSTDIITATAVSGIRSAFLDMFSKRMDLRLLEYLSINSELTNNFSEEVKLYANINRSLLPNDIGPVDRSPESFSKRAVEMQDKGFDTIKCAPFDECMYPFNNEGLPNESIIGLDRITEISNSISKDTKLFVDCHSRFDLESSYHIHDELKDRNVSWFEEPMDPEKFPEETKKIRNYSKIDLAGAEMAYGSDLMSKLINEEVLDIVMPDVKFCGGPTEVIKLFSSIPNPKQTISMHCPSGPISLLTSAHITSVINSNIPLEHAVEEVVWRKDLIYPNEKIINGHIQIPEEKGIGAILNLEMIIKNGKVWEE